MNRKFERHFLYQYDTIQTTQQLQTLQKSQEHPMEVLALLSQNSKILNQCRHTFSHLSFLILITLKI